MHIHGIIICLLSTAMENAIFWLWEYPPHVHHQKKDSAHIQHFNKLTQHLEASFAWR